MVIISSCDDFATVLARARAKIENAVAGAHHVGIVLHNQHGVSEVPQSVQNVDQSVRIAGVQPDRWLVEHVECSNQLRSQRGRELNALRLATGEG